MLDVLYRNSMRDTGSSSGEHGLSDEEDEQLMLSANCLSFLLEASRFPDLRKYFRTVEAGHVLVQALKNEELFHTPTKGDVVVEQTWSGRNTDLLVESLAGVRASKLNIRKKPAFRVLARLADVLQGRSDVFRKITTPGTGYLAMARREAAMWPDEHADFEAEVGGLFPVFCAGCSGPGRALGLVVGAHGEEVVVG